jgi:hypothetical protein
MDPLVLPSIRTTIASPTKGKASTSKQSTGRSRPGSRSVSPAPPGTSAQSTPGSPARRSIQAAIPNIDKDKCELLANITEQEMSLKAIGELEALRNELQASAIEASQHLTALLEKKESLTSQNNTYNAMIQVCRCLSSATRRSTNNCGYIYRTWSYKLKSLGRPPHQEVALHASRRYVVPLPIQNLPVDQLAQPTPASRTLSAGAQPHKVHRLARILRGGVRYGSKNLVHENLTKERHAYMYWEVHDIGNDSVHENLHSRPFSHRLHYCFSARNK